MQKCQQRVVKLGQLKNGISDEQLLCVALMLLLLLLSPPPVSHEGGLGPVVRSG